MQRFALFMAALSTVLALGGALAHAYELPNKIGLNREDYFVAQQLYQGWSNFAFIISIQMTTILACLIVFWRDRSLRGPFTAALLLLIAAQVVFWALTYPANEATQNWTTLPENWEALRRQWEYSHLAGAGLQLGVFAAIAWALTGYVPRAAARPCDPADAP